MHPLHQEIKLAEARQSAMEGLLIPFMVPLVLCYLVAAISPFLLIYTNGDGLAGAMWSIFNAILGAVIGVLGACVFAWKRKMKVALRILMAGLALWLFAIIMFKIAFFVCGIPHGHVVVNGVVSDG